MRDTAKLRGLASEERLPPGSTTDSGVLSSPINKVGSVLVRTHEKNLLLAVKINDGVLDPGGFSRQQKIQDTVDVLLKGLSSSVLLLRVQENDTLGTTFRDVLVLTLLRVGQTVVLIEEVTGVDAVSFFASGLYDTDTTTGDITETQVETTRLGTDDQKHAIQGSRVLSLG